jgi:decaprenylphospho-beta-D-erythro-pentofuranosid-2-ulose 2-reductase
MRDALGEPQSLLVLGATSDIARAVTRRLVARRARRVVLAARRPGDLAAFADELRALGATDVACEPFDARAVDEHEAFLGRCVDRLGDVDVVLLAFGVLGEQSTFDIDAGAAVDAAVTNYVGAVSTGLRVAECFRHQGHGQLVVLSSVAGERVRKANFVYGSTKAGLDGFAQGLGDALAGTGAQVLIVRPGFVRSKMTAGLPSAPMSTTPEAVADAVVRAMRHGREVVYVPSALRYVFMGFRHLPRAVWRRLPM